MKQFTSSLDFSLTKKRLKMMGKRISKIKVSALWVFVLPLSVAAVIVFSAQSGTYPNNINLYEYGENNPTTYHDIELESKGITGLYHPLDERTGIVLGPDGNPYTGEQNTYRIEDDSLLFKQTYANGKVIRTEYNMHDSTGNKYTSVTIPSLDADGNRVTTFYNNRLTDSLVLSYIRTETDSLTFNVIYYPNGQVANDFKIRPEYGLHGLSTIYNEQGEITGQRVYDNGEIIEELISITQ